MRARKHLHLLQLLPVAFDSDPVSFQTEIVQMLQPISGQPLPSLLRLFR